MNFRVSEVKKMFPNFFKEHTYDQHSKVSAYHPFFDYSGSPVKNCSKVNL